jgi:hypothetical protein
MPLFGGMHMPLHGGIWPARPGGLGSGVRQRGCFSQKQPPVTDYLCVGIEGLPLGAYGVCPEG